MKKKKLFSLVLATVLTAATVLPCYGASTKEKISNAQAEQAAAQSQLDSIQSRIDELNSKKGQSEEYLSELNQQLDDLQNRLQELQDQYDAKQNELVQIQADLEDAKAKEEEQYEAMKLRIQYMYENSSGNGYMAMLFSSKSISELISRAEYIQKISDFDRDLMQEYEDTVNQVKEKETQVQEEQAAIVELQQQSSDQQEAIQELYAAAYQELRTYSAELDDAKSSESALVDEINSKADAINDLIRQAKEEEIAAQKKAEEEEEKKEEKAGKAAVSPLVQQYLDLKKRQRPPENRQPRQRPQESQPQKQQMPQRKQIPIQAAAPEAVLRTAAHPPRQRRVHPRQILPAAPPAEHTLEDLN